MRKFIFILLILSLCQIGCGQVNQYDQLLLDLKTLSSSEMAGRATGTDGHKAAMEYLINRFQSIGLKSFNTDYTHEFEVSTHLKIPNDRGYNLVGFLPGKSSEAIVISAHYDHLGTKDGQIYYGSDDNASGVAAMLYMAEKLSKRERQHTFVFAAFDVEEHGLVGAKAFVKDLPTADIGFNLNMDMISKNDNNEIYACGTYHYPELKSFIKEMKESLSVSVLFGHDDPSDPPNDWTNSSDHAPFHQMGVPFLYFGVEDHKHYHQPSDTYESTNFDFYQGVVSSLADIVFKLDNQELTRFKNP